MTDENTQQPNGVASDLNNELDVINNNMMCHWIDDTEISHYLFAHINDQDNLTYEQKHACIDASCIIDELRREVFKLRNRVYELENDCVICGCGDIYKNGTLGAAMIEKCGSCENCVTDI
jgi:hypothetical protein